MKKDGKDYSLEKENNVSVQDIFEEAKKKNIMDWGEIDTAESVINRKQ